MREHLVFMLTSALGSMGDPIALVLCSDRDALQFTPDAGGWRTRLQRRFSHPRLKDFVSTP